MKVLQSIYTSCKVGQSGYSGFQFYSFSEGLTEPELLEIGKIGNYIAPFHLPANPTKEEIDNLLPISFSYFRLSSGRVGVVQSIALISDYSGRPGNFLAHAFVLDEGEFPFLPIRLYKSQSFKNDLSADEWAVTAVPKPLPVLNINELRLNPDISLENIGAFLEANDTLGYLPKLIDAVICNAETSRRTVLCDDFYKTPYWIAALSWAFPPYLAQQLTFTTYSIDPTNNNFVLAATSNEGSRFNFFNEVACNHQYFVFNFLSNRFSALDYSSSYAEAANTAITIKYELFVKLQSFFDGFNYPCIKKDIDVIYKLFVAQENKTNSYVEWYELLSFISLYGKDENIKNFFSDYKTFLLNTLDTLSTNKEEIAKFFALLVNVYKQTQNNADFALIFDLYLMWLFDQQFGDDENEYFSKENILSLLEKNEGIVNHLLQLGDTFSRNFFSENAFDRLYNSLSGCFHNFSAFVLSVIFQNLTLSGYRTEQLFCLRSFRKIADVFAENNGLDRRLLFFFSHIDSQRVVPFLDYLSADLSSGQLLNIVKLGTVKTDLLYNQVKDTRNTKMFISLTPYFIDSTQNKRNRFTDMQSFLSTKQVSSAQYDFLIQSYTQSNKKLAKDELVELIQLAEAKSCFERLPALIEQYESLVKISDTISKRDAIVISELLSIKQNHDIETKNLVCELCTVLIDITQKKVTTVLNVFKSFNFKMESISVEICNLFMARLFNLIIPLIEKTKDYYYILIFIDNQSASSFSAFQKELVAYHNNNSKDLRTIELFIKFYLNLSDYKLEIDEKWESRIRELIVTILVKSNQSVFDSLNLHFSDKKNDHAKEWKALWDEAVEKRGNTLSGVFKKYFNSFLNKK